MTTNPVPPEALAGCECLVWTTESRHPKIAKFDGTHWLVLDHRGKFIFEFPNVTRAIPMSVVEAAPGMREALKRLVETDSGMSNQREFNIARAALAACDGKGE